MVIRSTASKKLLRVFNASFFILLSLVILSAASVGLFYIPFFGEDGRESDIPLYTGILRLLLPIVFFALISLLFIRLIRSANSARLRRLRNRRFNTKAIFISVGILLLIQLFTAFWLRMSPVTDVAILDSYAEKIVTENSFACLDSDFNGHYIVWYQNNIPCLLIYVLIYKLAYFFTGNISPYPMLVFNVLCINSAILMTVLTARRLFGEKKAIITLILCALFTPYYTYTPYYYTDTFSIPFVAGAVYAFVAASQSKTRGKKALLFAICGALCCIGSRIKGSVLILLFAMVIYLLFHFGIKRAAKAGGVILLSFCVLLASFTAALKASNLISDESSDRYQVPTTHWVMMGLGELGRFKYDDFMYTMRSDTKAERAEADIEEIGRRISQKGVGGMLFHLEQKAAWTYVDGTYNISHYIEWSEYETPLHALIIKGRELRYPFFAYSFAYQMFLLAAMAYSGYNAFKRRKYAATDLFRIAVFGAILFFEVWEANARYLFNLTPLYILLATEGAFGFVEQHRKNGVSTLLNNTP